jgi:hypothetical protein
MSPGFAPSLNSFLLLLYRKFFERFVVCRQLGWLIVGGWLLWRLAGLVYAFFG